MIAPPIICPSSSLHFSSRATYSSCSRCSSTNNSNSCSTSNRFVQSKYIMQHNMQLVQVQPKNYRFTHISLCSLQSMEHRLHSTSHSLQATPNSTIHSLGPPTHPRLADLWAASQVEPHQMEIMGHMSITLADMGTPESYGEELVIENECIPEQQEEEEAKVCSLQFCHFKKNNNRTGLYITMESTPYLRYKAVT